MSSRRDRVSPAKFVSHLTVFLVVSVVVGVLVAGLAIPLATGLGLGAKQVAQSMDDLPRDLETAPLSQRTRVLAADGSLLATWYDKNRTNVSLGKVALVMRKAILSIEDYRFYEHGALDVRGTVRALVTNQASGGVVQGGSSITQQMVKQTLINQAQNGKQAAAATADTFERKLKELRYAIAVEQKYSKDWILERYLNISYFGDGAYGVEAAARHYFSVPAARLGLGQAALLAGIVKNPSLYDPTNNASASRQRRNLVLARMAQLHVISEKRARKESKQSLGLKISQDRNGCVGTNGEFFCAFVRDYLLQDPSLGKTLADRKDLLDGGGLTIETTIDPRFQRAADAAVRSHVYPTDQALGGLAMVVPGTGEVRALAQSRPMGPDRAIGQSYLSYVTPPEYGGAAGFPAGSTFKAFVLAAAINQGIPLSTKIKSPSPMDFNKADFTDCNGPMSYEPFPIENSTGEGTFDLYTGTRNSVNTFFVQLEQRTGICEPVTLARKMGVTVPENAVVPTFTLGVSDTNVLTMANAYATFAARGVYCEPKPVSRILGPSGKVLAEYPDTCRQVMPQSTADAVSEVLKGVMAPGGFGQYLNPGIPSAGKTGTISDNKAVWFVGYTPALAAASMLGGANTVGYPITLNRQTVGGRYISTAHGSTEAGPMWGDAMKAIVSLLPATDFAEPDPTAVAGRTISVPSVGGLSPEAASSLLREAGFSPSIGSYVDSSYGYGTAAYSSPSSGSSAGSGSTVTIYLSDGTPAPPPRNNGGKGGRGNGGRGR